MPKSKNKFRSFPRLLDWPRNFFTGPKAVVPHFF